MSGDRVIRPDWCRQDKGQFVLANRVARPILRSRFGAGISEALKPECCLVEMRRLLGVSDIKLDVIGTLQWEKIFLDRRRLFSSWSSNCRWHKRPPQRSCM